MTQAALKIAESFLFHQPDFGALGDAKKSINKCLREINQDLVAYRNLHRKTVKTFRDSTRDVIETGSKALMITYRCMVVDFIECARRKSEIEDARLDAALLTYQAKADNISGLTSENQRYLMRKLDEGMLTFRAYGELRWKFIAFMENEVLAHLDDALLATSDRGRDSGVILDELISRFPKVNTALAE